MTEEKKAISLLKSYENKLVYEISDKDKKAVKILLNLIDKQQRIIKSQEKIIMEQEKEINKYKNQEYGKLFNGRYISKDKIRDKIKKLKIDCNICELEKILDCNTQCTIGGTIKALKELLEEGEPDAK